MSTLLTAAEGCKIVGLCCVAITRQLIKRSHQVTVVGVFSLVTTQGSQHGRSQEGQRFHAPQIFRRHSHFCALRGVFLNKNVVIRPKSNFLAPQMFGLALPLAAAGGFSTQICFLVDKSV